MANMQEVVTEKFIMACKRFHAYRGHNSQANFYLSHVSTLSDILKTSDFTPHQNLITDIRELKGAVTNKFYRERVVPVIEAMTERMKEDAVPPPAPRPHQDSSPLYL